MQHDVVGNDRILALPGWKRLLWHDISLAAKLKDAFDASDYDSTGDLNADSPKLEQLYTWLQVSRRTEAQFKSIRPAWRHFAHSNWELTFLAVWTEATQSAGTKKHIYRKTTGIMVEGRDPTDSISEEWVLVHSEEIPGHGEEGAESEEYCDML